MFGFVNSETRLKLAKLQAPRDTAVVLHDPVQVRAANQKKLQITVLCSEMYDLHPTVMIAWTYILALNARPDVDLVLYDLSQNKSSFKAGDPCRRIMEELGGQYRPFRDPRTEENMTKIASQISQDITQRKTGILLCFGCHQHGCEVQQQVMALKPAA